MILQNKYLNSFKKGKFTASLLLLILLLSFIYIQPTHAADSSDPNYEYALKLKELGVFTDVPTWAIGYANYAKANQLTQGVTATVFGSLNTLTLEQYTSFLLRSLQYNDSKGDFTYATVLSKADEIGVFSSPSLISGTFTRSIVAKLSYDILLLPIKQSSASLAQYLVNTGAIDETIAIDIKIIIHPAVIDGKTYALKDSIFYTLGESNASVDVLSSATVQRALKSDVFDHYSSTDTQTTSIITFPTMGFKRLVFWSVASNNSSINAVKLFNGNYTYLDKLTTQKPTKTVSIGDSAKFISIDLLPYSSNSITLQFTLDGSGHFYMYSVFLE